MSNLTKIIRKYEISSVVNLVQAYELEGSIKKHFVSYKHGETIYFKVECGNQTAAKRTFNRQRKQLINF